MNNNQMEVRVLRAEKAKLIQMIEHMRAQSEKDKAIELFLAHALTGYCSQPQASQDPKWAAEMAIKTMNQICLELERMVAAHTPVTDSELQNFQEGEVVQEAQ